MFSRGMRGIVMLHTIRMPAISNGGDGSIHVITAVWLMIPTVCTIIFGSTERKNLTHDSSDRDLTSYSPLPCDHLSQIIPAYFAPNISLAMMSR